MKIKEEIIICEECKGTGFDKYGDKCNNCNGYGRLLQQTTITVSPLDEENFKRKAVYG